MSDTNCPPRSIDRARSTFEQTRFDPVAVNLNQCSEDKDPQTRSLALSNSSTGSIYYEPERKRIIWEASPSRFHSQAATSDRPMLHHRSLSSQQVMGLPELRTNSLFLSGPNQMPVPVNPLNTPYSCYDRSSSDSSAHHQSSIPFSSPCSVKWLSVRSVSFEMVRGLQNRWNSNQAVYIARNVTAVEPTAGATLLGLFQRLQGSIT